MLPSNSCPLRSFDSLLRKIGACWKDLESLPLISTIIEQGPVASSPIENLTMPVVSSLIVLQDASLTYSISKNSRLSPINATPFGWFGSGWCFNLAETFGMLFVELWKSVTLHAMKDPASFPAQSALNPGYVSSIGAATWKK